MGFVADQLGQYTEALQYIQQVARFAAENKDWDGEVDARLTLGGIYMHLGEFDQAQAHLEYVLALSRDMELKTNECDTLLALGKLALYREEFQSAQRFSREALDLAQDLNLPREVITGKLLEGRALIATSKVKPAYDLFTQILETAQTLGVTGLVQETRAGMALACQEAGELDAALMLVDQIVDYLEAGDHGIYADKSRIALERIEEPFWVLFACYQVLKACGDARAGAILEFAKDHITSIANRPGHESWRKSYLVIPLLKHILEVQ